jgi:UDP-glucuronate decarboxylase
MHFHDGRVVSNFMVQALRHEPITLYGDGNQTRSFCYVSDLIDGLVRLMESEHDAKPTNLGNPDECTIRGLAEKVVALTQSQSKLVYEQLPSDDPTRRKPDITLAKQALGWEPRVPLEDGLRATLTDFRKRLWG